MADITVNMENLTDSEREKLMELIEKANKPKGGLWKLEDEENYYFINGEEHIIETYWADCSVDNNRFSVGNIFKTREDAEVYVEKLKVIHELKMIAAEEELPEWDMNNEHHEIYYDFAFQRICVMSMVKSVRNVIYFASYSLAQKAIDTIGEKRLKKYYFEVEE